MTNQKKVGKKLQQLEDQYVQATLSEKFKDEEVKELYEKKKREIEKKYDKVLLKANFNKEMTVLKRKKIGLKLAKAGAKILKRLGQGLILLVPFAVSAGLGAIVGLTVGAFVSEAAAFTAGMTSAFGGAALGGVLDLAFVWRDLAEEAFTTERMNDWFVSIGDGLCENAEGLCYTKKEAFEEREIKNVVKDKRRKALDKAVTEAEERIKTRQKRSCKEQKQNALDEKQDVLRKPRAAIAEFRQTETADAVVGEQPEA